MSVNMKRRLIKKSKLLGSDEDSPRKKIHTENDEKIRSSSVESNKSKENNDFNQPIYNKDDYTARQKLLQELNDDVMESESPIQQKNPPRIAQNNEESSSISISSEQEAKKKKTRSEKSKKPKKILEKNENLLETPVKRNDQDERSSSISISSEQEIKKKKRLEKFKKSKKILEKNENLLDTPAKISELDDSFSLSVQGTDKKKKKRIEKVGKQKEKSKRVLEKNDALLQKMIEKNDIFNQEEETDEEFNERALHVLKHLEDKQAYKRNKGEGGNVYGMTKPKKDMNRIDIKNKLFSDINPTDIMRSDDDEPIQESQVIASGKLIIEDEPKLKKNLCLSFMNSMAKFKQERGLCEPSQPLNDVQNIISDQAVVYVDNQDNGENSQQMSQFESLKVPKAMPSESAKKRLQTFITDQNSRNQNDDDIEIQIKEFNQENSMTNNTLFIQKLSRTMSENGLIARSLNNKFVQQKEEPKGQVRKGKKISRDEYYKSILDEVKATRQKTLSVQQIKDLFQTKDFDILQNQINKQKKTKKESKEGEKPHLGQVEDLEEEDSKEDEDYAPGQDPEEGEEVQDENAIEIEEYSQEKDQIENLQEKSQSEDLIVEEIPEIEQNNDDQIQEEIEENSQEKSPYRVNDDDEEENEESAVKMPLKRLKNVQRELLYRKNLRKNLKEQERMERQRKILEKKAQREKELEEHPELREIQQKLLENEADQGSDNEEHDDVVKAIDYEKELQEEGLQGLDLDADLENLINNCVEYDEENEQVAYNQYFKDLQKEDQELVKRVIAGRFKTRNQRRNNMYLEDHLNEEDDHKKRLKRIDDQIKQLQENEEESTAGGMSSGKKASGEIKEDEELKSCQLKQLLYLKKKELEKMSSQVIQEDIQHISNISQQVLEWVKKQTINTRLPILPVKKIIVLNKKVGMESMDILDPNIQLKQKSSFLGVKNNIKTISQFTIGEHINEIITTSLGPVSQVNENSLSSKMFNSFSKLISKDKEIATPTPKMKGIQRQSSTISTGSNGGSQSNMSSSLNKFFGQHTLLSGRSPGKIISSSFQMQKMQKQSK